jgi:hypothetical protein
VLVLVVVLVPLAAQLGAVSRTLADGAALHAAAKDPSAATPTAPPMKRRRDHFCVVVSVTILGTSMVRLLSVNDLAGSGQGGVPESPA